MFFMKSNKKHLVFKNSKQLFNHRTVCVVGGDTNNMTPRNKSRGFFIVKSLF